VGGKGKGTGKVGEGKGEEDWPSFGESGSVSVWNMLPNSLRQSHSDPSSCTHHGGHLRVNFFGVVPVSDPIS